MSETSETETSERERRLEAEAKLALAEVELRISKAEADQRIAVLEVQLAAERETAAVAEHTSRSAIEMTEFDRERQLAQLRREIECWRRNDRPGLVRTLRAALEVLDRVAQSSEVNSAQEAERRDILAALERLEG